MTRANMAVILQQFFLSFNLVHDESSGADRNHKSSVTGKPYRNSGL